MAKVVSYVVLMLLGEGLISAQVNKSNLSGVVRDPSGAAVAGTIVKVTNLGTGAVRQEKSDSTGLYRFILLDHGIYRIAGQ